MRRNTYDALQSFTDINLRNSLTRDWLTNKHVSNGHLVTSLQTNKGFRSRRETASIASPNAVSNLSLHVSHLKEIIGDKKLVGSKKMDRNARSIKSTFKTCSKQAVPKTMPVDSEDVSS